MALSALAIADGPLLPPAIDGPTYVGTNTQRTYDVTIPVSSGINGAGTVDLYLDGVHVGGGITPAFHSKDVRPPKSDEILVPFFGKARGAHTLVAVADDGTPLATSSAPFTVHVAVPPGPPATASAAREQHADALLVAWGPPSDDGGAPLLRTTLQRQDGGANGPWGMVDRFDPTVGAFEDVGVMGTTLCYRATATNVAGEGPPGGAGCATLDSAWPPTSMTAHIDSFTVCLKHYADPRNDSTTTMCPKVPRGGRVNTANSSGEFTIYPNYSGQISDDAGGIRFARAHVNDSGDDTFRPPDDLFAVGPDAAVADDTGGLQDYGPPLIGTVFKNFCDIKHVHLAITSDAGPSASDWSTVTVCWL